MRKFSSTEAAYGACQCDESIKNGDALVIASECVVGLAWTWPLAITVANGELHTASASDGSEERLMNQAGITTDQLRAAIQIAEANFWPVRDGWRAAAAATVGDTIRIPAWKIVGVVTQTRPATLGTDAAIEVLVGGRWYRLEPTEYSVVSADQEAK